MGGDESAPAAAQWRVVLGLRVVTARDQEAITLSTKSPAEIVRTFWNAFSTRRFDEIFRDVMASDCEFIMPGAPPMKGAPAIRAMFEAYARAFPDFTWSLIHGIEHGDTFAGEATYTGTHRAPLATPQGEVPATGKVVAWQSADIVRIAAGKIVSWHVYNDPLAIMAQLGVPMG
jgi:ketosteroid isomerase-like protein